MTTEPSTDFTFEQAFRIRPCSNGGYVIEQGSAEGFERAFSELNDVVIFLVEQKREFEDAK